MTGRDITFPAYQVPNEFRKEAVCLSISRSIIVVLCWEGNKRESVKFFHYWEKHEAFDVIRSERWTSTIWSWSSDNTSQATGQRDRKGRSGWKALAIFHSRVLDEAADTHENSCSFTQAHTPRDDDICRDPRCARTHHKSQHQVFSSLPFWRSSAVTQVSITARRSTINYTAPEKRSCCIQHIIDDIL